MARLDDRFAVSGPDLNEGLSYSIKPSDLFQAQIQMRSNQLAASRERYSRQLLERRLPCWLHWLLDHPRLLKRVLRVVKLWKPTLTVVPLRHPLPVGFSRSAALKEAKYCEREMRVTGKRIPAGGLVFTYIDANWLPAEVYGP